MEFKEPTVTFPSNGTYRWIPTMDIVPGMVVARPVLGGPRNQVSLYIAVGNTITADTIFQLINKGVECVAVFQDAPSDEASHVETMQNYEARLEEIFGAQPDESCRQLIRALLAKRYSKC